MHEFKKYKINECIVFKSNKDAFGELSNMAYGFNLTVNNLTIRTTEALYQACRFPYDPDIQSMLIEQKRSMAVKMKSRAYIKDKSRKDWEEIRIVVMKWCLDLKLAQNWEKFGKVLLKTGNHDIVENSNVDDFWGAKPNGEFLIGANVLGKLLQQLRLQFYTNPHSFTQISPPNICNFLLLGKNIDTIITDIKNINLKDSVMNL